MSGCSQRHVCYCGTCPDVPHETGFGGCVRRMEPAPELVEDGWLVEGFFITDSTLRQQRGYHQHGCGCWSSWAASVNSIDA